MENNKEYKENSQQKKQEEWRRKTNNGGKKIDFEKLDESIRNLVEIIRKRNLTEGRIVKQKSVNKPKIKKKLNVDLIKQMIKETKDIQQKHKKNN